MCIMADNTNLSEGVSIRRDTSIDVDSIMKQAGRTKEFQTENTSEKQSDPATPPASSRGVANEQSETVETKQPPRLEHGDIAQLDDGTTGIVVDLQKQREDLQKEMEIPGARQFVDDSVPLYDVMSGEPNTNAQDLGLQIIKENPDSMDAMAISDVKNAFANFAPALHGAAPIGSEEVTKFENAKQALRSGEVRLPTPEEYAQQKEHIKEEMKKKEEIHQMEQRNVQTPTPPAQNSSPSEPINLAAMEQRRMMEQQSTPTPPVPQQNDIPTSLQDKVVEGVTKFTIPEGKTSEFIGTLTRQEQEKVETSKVIKVEEERVVKVPVATRRITNLDDYKRLSEKKSISESVEVPLLNSGYIATVSGCSSMEMASIVPSPRGTEMEWEDYGKLYNFCYRRLVSTNIGRLSFMDFQRETSPYDLPAYVYGILRASQPDVSSITLTCGGADCRKDYDIEYSLSELPDWDSVTDEIKNRMQQLLRVRDLQDDAKKLHEQSPVMNVKYVDVGDGKTVVIKSPDGPMIVERTNEDLMQEIADATNMIVAIFLMNIKSIFITTPNEVVELVDLMTIATELETFSDTQLEILKSELQTIEVYDEITYSFKKFGGKPIVCPYCGLENKSVPCNIPQLVFHRVSRAMS